MAIPMILCLATVAILSSGCVTRTVTSAPANRGSSMGGQKYGSKSEQKVLEKKRIWIWQDEYRNP